MSSLKWLSSILARMMFLICQHSKFVHGPQSRRCASLAIDRRCFFHGDSSKPCVYPSCHVLVSVMSLCPLMFCHPSPSWKATARLYIPHQDLLDNKIYWEVSPYAITFSVHMVSIFKSLVDILMFYLKLRIDLSKFRIYIVHRWCHRRKHFWYCRNVQFPVPRYVLLSEAVAAFLQYPCTASQMPTKKISGIQSCFWAVSLFWAQHQSGNDPSITCAYNKETSSRSGFPIIFLAGVFSSEAIFTSPISSESASSCSPDDANNVCTFNCLPCYYVHHSVQR